MAKSTSHNQIAKRYASAIFALSGKGAANLLVESEKLKELAELNDVDAFFNNPLLTREQQAAIVKTLLESQGFSKLLVDAVARVALNRRLPLLAKIMTEFKAMVMKATGDMEVEIISAKPLDSNDIKNIAESLSKSYGRNIHAKASHDPSLIGGIMLKMNDSLIDYSVAGKLNRIGQQLKSVPLS